MTTNSLLSVIIPVYNSEKYLDKCLNSVCNQTYKNLQIIIVDDGSEDDSYEICLNYKKRDNRIECYKQNNIGVSSARNFGIKKASGQFITFVDSDDYLRVDAYEAALNNFKNVDVVMFGFIERYEEMNHSKIIKPEKEGVVSANESIYECLVPLGYEVTVWNKIYKKNLIENIGFDTTLKISEDELWLINVLKNSSNVLLINEPLYYYVQRKDSAMRSSSTIDEKWLSAIRAKKMVMNELAYIDRCNELSKARFYQNLFGLLVIAYCSNDYDHFETIYKVLNPYRSFFYRAKEYSLNIKIKYSLILFLFVIKAPKSIIKGLEKITTYKILLALRNLRFNIV